MNSEISEKLLQKSKSFLNRANDLGMEDIILHPLLISLSLEFAIRSALASVNPILTLDFHRQEQNIISFFLDEDKDKIKTAGINQVVNRLTSFIPDFTENEVKVVNAIFEARNIEVHSSELGFTKYPPEVWLPSFYRIVTILLDFMGQSGQEFFGQYFQDISEEISRQETLTKTEVLNLVATHKKRFIPPTPTLEEPSYVVIRANEIRKNCPSCSLKGILSGKNISKSKPKISDEIISETFDYLPTSFKCEHCGLEVKGSQEIKHIENLSEIFQKTVDYDPMDYLNIDIEERIAEKYADYKPEPEYMDE